MSSFTGQGRLLSSFILIHKPIRVANEQWGIVGLNSTLTTFILPTVGGCTWNNIKINLTYNLTS